MSSRKRSADEALEHERARVQAQDINTSPVPHVMGIIQSTVRHWTGLIFGGWLNAQDKAATYSSPGPDRHDQRIPSSNSRAEGRGSDGRLRDGINESRRRRGDDRDDGVTIAKRRRLTPPDDNIEPAKRPRQRIQSSQRFAQSLQPRDHRSRQRSSFNSSHRAHDRRHASFTQSLNRKSLLQAREKQRARSLDARKAEETRAPEPLATIPRTREEVDDLFIPKKHGLLDDGDAYPTPDSTPRKETPSATQSPVYEAQRNFSDSIASTESRTSVDSTPYIPRSNRTSTYTPFRSTYQIGLRPVQRDSGPSEPIDYARRIQALLRDDEEHEPRLSRRKQLEIEEKRRLRDEEQREKEREAEEQRLREEAEAKKKRRIPKKPLIPPLEQEWEDRVNDAIYTNNPSKIVTTSIGGTELIPKDFRTVLGARSWLNDEIINSYIEWVVDSANKMVPPNKAVGSDKPVPKFIAHNSFFYENITKKGPTSTDRLMKRKGAPGKSLLQVDLVLVPICRNSHWTVGVVRPAFKTIEYFDSFGGQSQTGIQFKAHMRAWLAHQLGDSYVADEWSEPDTGCASQTNGWDCGVFVCTNAFCVAFGLETSCYVERDMETQRRRIAAVLINRGFHGDFSWENGGW